MSVRLQVSQSEEKGGQRQGKKVVVEVYQWGHMEGGLNDVFSFKQF